MDSSEEKNFSVTYNEDALEPQHGQASGYSTEKSHGELHKGLKDRHLSMIALGGALGTGLLIGT